MFCSLPRQIVSLQISLVFYCSRRQIVWNEGLWDFFYEICCLPQENRVVHIFHFDFYNVFLLYSTNCVVRSPADIFLVFCYLKNVYMKVTSKLTDGCGRINPVVEFFTPIKGCFYGRFEWLCVILTIRGLDFGVILQCWLANRIMESHSLLLENCCLANS